MMKIEAHGKVNLSDWYLEVLEQVSDLKKLVLLATEEAISIALKNYVYVSFPSIEQGHEGQIEIALDFQEFDAENMRFYIGLPELVSCEIERRQYGDAKRITDPDERAELESALKALEAATTALSEALAK